LVTLVFHNANTLHPSILPFLDFLQFEKRYSPHTVRSYRDDLDQFFQFIAKEFDGLFISEINSPIVRTWLASLKDAGMASKSINRKISSLRSFFKFQMSQGTLSKSPMDQILSPKIGKRLPVYVEKKDLSTLFSTIEFPDDWAGHSDRLLLSILYHTGIRVSELVNLKEKQVDLGHRTLKVLGKGNKERIIPVSPDLIQMIQDYISRKRKELKNPDLHYLLVNQKGSKIYTQYAYRAVKRYLGQVTTIDKKSPHILRHSFATHLANNGADLNAIKELLGHSSLASTQVYTHNTIEKLKNIHQKAHPKA
jgi:integrase/recombinase XerC